MGVAFPLPAWYNHARTTGPAGDAGLAEERDRAFFVSTTNSVVAGLDSVVRVATENKIPLFGNDPLSASREIKSPLPPAPGSAATTPTEAP